MWRRGIGVSRYGNRRETGMEGVPARQDGYAAPQTHVCHETEGAAIMRGKLMFLGGLAAGFVLGSRAGREKYEEIRANAQKLWEHPTVQEAAGVAQAQANKLYTEGKDKLQSSKLGEKLGTTSSSTSGTTGTDRTDELLAPTDTLSGTKGPGGTL
ncbi:hypothetical protein Ate01nite_62290 [Actinoplanes teichomyceticus]|nr:hypothetical protein Ate01nite_62290 [Actinoplanes teichomyceticus]